MRWFPALITFLIAAPAAADSTLPPLPLPPGSAMIYSPGTADFIGYRIVISPNGDAVAVDGAGRAQWPVPGPAREGALRRFCGRRAALEACHDAVSAAADGRRAAAHHVRR